MKAIQTKYLGPTNTRGGRIKAFDNNGNQRTVPWNHVLNAEENHQEAAKALASRMLWNPKALYTGQLKDTYVHLLLPQGAK
jgi:hypothetical protein